MSKSAQALTDAELLDGALSLCGLSKRSGADFLRVSYSSISKWGKPDENPVPDGVWIELAALYAAITTGTDLDTDQDGPARAQAAHARLIKAKL